MPRHNLFSNGEMRDVVCVYAQSDYVGRRALRRYLELYPNRRQPNRKLFQELFNRLGETGSFRPKRDNAGRTVTVQQEEEILVRVAGNPEVSSRQVARETGVSKTTVLKIFHKENLYPYHFTPVQNLLAADLPARLQFAHFMCNQQNLDQEFLGNVLIH